MKTQYNPSKALSTFRIRFLLPNIFFGTILFAWLLALNSWLLFCNFFKPTIVVQMKNLAILLLLLPASLFAQNLDTLAMYQAILDSVESTFRYEKGDVTLSDGIATIKVPEGFKYLNAEQSETVLTQLWGNPDGTGTLGMLFPENTAASAEDAWAFVITYDEIGYVKDNDADDIDYDDLLKEMHTDMDAANKERANLGYETVQLIGWAAEPYYDKERKVLHWAKELKFGTAESNTLNYNVRVLGRKGVLILNAVGGMDQLPTVNKNIGNVLSSVDFSSGYKYAEFDPKLDEVAAWTLGGLVAGKVLMKVGIFALLLKNIKLVALALFAIGGAIWRFVTGRKKEDEPAPNEPMIQHEEG